MRVRLGDFVRVVLVLMLVVSVLGAVPETPASAGSDPALSSGPDTIVFSGQLDPGGVALFLYDVASGTETPIPGTDGGNYPDWSPDGTRIAYTNGREVAVVDPATGTVTTVVPFSVGLFPQRVSWSPDAQWIAFDASDNIWVVPSDGSAAPTQLTSSTLSDTNVAWSSDGRIAFRRNGIERVWVGTFDPTTVTLTGLTGLANSTTIFSQQREMDWSPDNGSIVLGAAFNAATDDELFILPTDGVTPATQITTTAGDDTAPSWSPGGTEIVFVSNRNGGRDIYTIPPTGGATDGTLLYDRPGFDLYSVDWGRYSAPAPAVFADNEVMALEVRVGVPFDAQFSFFNGGTVDATGVVASVPTPSWVDVSTVVASPTVGTYDPVTGVWNIGTLPANFVVDAYLYLSWTAMLVPAGGLGCYDSVLVSLDQPGDDPSDNASNGCVPVVPGTVSVSTNVHDNGPSLYEVGELYSLTVQVDAEMTGASGVDVSFVVPSWVDPATVSMVFGQGSWDPMTGVWTVGTLPPNTIVEMVVQWAAASVPNDGSPGSGCVEAVVLSADQELDPANDFGSGHGWSKACETIVDTTPPALTLPADKVLEATSPTGAVATWTVSAVDSVDGPVSAACVPPSGSEFGLGAWTSECSASDAAGNTATGSFAVNVVDTTPPVLNLPSNITIPATSETGIGLSFVVTASDLVDPAVTPTCVPPSGSTFPIGTTTVDCTATDISGNSSSGSFTVTVTPVPTNRPPTATSSNVSTKEDKSVKFTLQASDPDGDPLTYQYSTYFVEGTVSCSGARCTYTPPKDFNGSERFVFDVSDGEFTATATVWITVTKVPDRPKITNVSTSRYTRWWSTWTAEGATGVLYVDFEDVDQQNPNNYDITVFWGDGTSTKIRHGTIDQGFYDPTLYSFLATHTYKRFGTKTVTVRIIDKVTGLNTQRKFKIQAGDASIWSGGLIPGSGSIIRSRVNTRFPPRGAPESRIGCVSDANTFGIPGDLSATVRWGDGSTSKAKVVRAKSTAASSCRVNGWDYTVSASHKYKRTGTFTIRVTVKSKGGSSTSFNYRVKVVR